MQTAGLRFLVPSLLGILLLGRTLVATADGAATFQEKCATCHGDKGQGIEGLAPPLKGNTFVTSASAADLKSHIVNGRTGKNRRYPKIPGGMPGVLMPEPELEALVKYVTGDLQK